MAISESTIVLLVRILMFIVYLSAGAAIFMVLERDHWVKEQKQTRSLRESIERKYNISQEDIEQWSQTFRPIPQVKDANLEWDFGNSFLFAMVTVTTIGYGNIVPKTLGGRLFCIFYALLGIPCTCLTLKVIGDKISEMVATLTATIERRLLKIQRPRNIELKTAVITVVSTAFVILPLLSTIVFVRQTTWSYFQCFYFTFTTLTTIGYGDFVPHFGNSYDFLLIIVAFLGLAFVSSIFCSLNILFDTFGLSARIIKTVKHKPSNKGTHEENGENNDDTKEAGKSQKNADSEMAGKDAMMSSMNNAKAKDDRTTAAPGKSDDSADEELRDEDTLLAKCFKKRDSTYGRQGKRDSVSVGIFSA